MGLNSRPNLPTRFSKADTGGPAEPPVIMRCKLSGYVSRIDCLTDPISSRLLPEVLCNPIAKPVLTPTSPIDWASAIDVTDAGGFANCLISNRRHDARPKDDACSCDATCRIIDILAVHYGTGLVGAYSYESGYQQRR
jgi:hypothetical protein